MARYFSAISTNKPENLPTPPTCSNGSIIHLPGNSSFQWAVVFAEMKSYFFGIGVKNMGK
jgi:hypothetical protein